MITVLPYRKPEEIEDLFKQNNIPFNDGGVAVKATDKDKLLGYALLTIVGGKLEFLYLEYFGDTLMADGIIRSALHLGTENGVTEAYLKNDSAKPIFKTLGFLIGDTEEINISKLFLPCGCGK